MVPPPDPIAALRDALRGRYEFEREIGQGAYATVYLAQDLKHERKVAIKVLPESLAKDADALSRFEREAHAVAAHKGAQRGEAAVNSARLKAIAIRRPLRKCALFFIR